MEPFENKNINRKKFTFEIFKGNEEPNGKITLAAKLGRATLYEGAKTYNLYINTFMSEESKIVFHLLPESDLTKPYSFVILTRQKSIMPERKYHWQRVGQAYPYDNQGEKLLRLDWHFFKTENIFMSLTPIPENLGASAQAVAA